METQQQQDHHHHQDLGGNKNGSSYGVCSSSSTRQSSSRWTPTSDQIRILKELYNTNGIRSPTADQIQRIAAQLRQYGKIEGKNVFYWFQNHKARERQKKRFTTTPTPSAVAVAAPPPPPCFSSSDYMINHHHHLPPNAAMQIPSHQYYHHHHQEPQPHNNNNVVYGHQHKLYTTHHIGVGSSSSSSSQGLMGVGCGYGSVAMEKSFRECSISPPGESRGGRNLGSRAQGVMSTTVESSSCSFFDKFKPTKTYHHHDELQILENHDEEGAGEIETLPLFPIHGGTSTGDDFFSFKTTTTTTTAASENNNNNYPACSTSNGGGGGYYTGGINWYGRSVEARASLELSLNSSYAATGYYYN